MKFKKIGYCMTASHCSFEAAYRAMESLALSGYELVPIMSENAYYTDTRFAPAEEFSARVEAICGRQVIHTIKDAEPLGPKTPLDLLVVAPCTGNTLAKMVHGITDTAATMAIKAHLRADRPTLLAIATNDAMSSNLANISRALMRKSVYLVPMRQDDPVGKPHSLVADFGLVGECVRLIEEHAPSALAQMRPLFLSK